MSDEVAVVIPTALSRPGLLERALRSVRAQRGVRVETVVVADVAAGTPLPDLGSDVSVIRSPGRTGAAAARNVGVAAAGAPWVAFLDDDDEWVPDKLVRQLAAAIPTGLNAIVSSRFHIVVDGQRRGVLPKRLPAEGADLSEFLFCRRLPHCGVGVAPTSTLLTSARLLERCPFDESLSQLQDVDWLLRAAARHGGRFVQLAEPLAAWHVDSGRSHISGADLSWLSVRDWVDAHGDLLTARSAAGAILLAASRKRLGRDVRREAITSAYERGTPRALDLAMLRVVGLAPHTARLAAGRLTAGRAQTRGEVA